jgi:predicted transcriptional regulator
MADLLKSVEIETVLATRTPIVLHAEESVNQVLEELSKNHITSAPVYDLDTKTPIGFVDTLDLVWCALDIGNSPLPAHQGIRKQK